MFNRPPVSRPSSANRSSGHTEYMNAGDVVFDHFVFKFFFGQHVEACRISLLLRSPVRVLLFIYFICYHFSIHRGICPCSTITCGCLGGCAKPGYVPNQISKSPLGTAMSRKRRITLYHIGTSQSKRMLSHNDSDRSHRPSYKNW